MIVIEYSHFIFWFERIILFNQVSGTFDYFFVRCIFLLHLDSPLFFDVTFFVTSFFTRKIAYPRSVDVWGC